MTHKVFTGKRAKADLQAIRDYIYSQSKDKEITTKAMDKIKETVDSLCHNPDRGANLRNKVNYDTDLKWISVYHYMIVYQLQKDGVYVIAVVHMSRNFASLPQF